MPVPTTQQSSELDAVNQILGSVGQAPVTTLDETNPEVSLAYTTLIEVSKEVQAEGWVYNREVGYPLQPDVDGYIQIPANMLRVDLVSNLNNVEYDTVLREGKLYDKQNQTYIWDTSKTYEAEVVWFFNFTDLPQPFRAYITARAAVICSTRFVGDKDLYTMLQQREAQARAMIMEYECNQGDYSMFGMPKGNDYYVSYQPFHALSR